MDNNALDSDMANSLSKALADLDDAHKGNRKPSLSPAAGSGRINASPFQPKAIPGEATAVPSVAVGSVPGYDELARILTLAYTQSAAGKGKERHAVGPVGFQPWHHQPILLNARQVGPAGPAQQVMKKAGESVMMCNRRDFAGAKAEALGAIVYAAALFKLYEEMEGVPIVE